jgi:hypothetical protein
MKDCHRFAGLLSFHHTRTFFATGTWNQMEYLERHGMSNGQIHILNIAILIISALSVTGAGWIILSFIVCSLSFILYCSALLRVLAVQISEDIQTPIDPVSNFLLFTSSLLPASTAASLPATS